MPTRVIKASGVPVNVASVGEGGGGGDVTWNEIKGKPSTFPPVIGTTATTAKAGNYVPKWDEVTGKPTSFPVAWGDVSGKPATFPPTIGNTATTAKAGDYKPAWTEISGKPSTFTPPAATSAAVGGVKQMAKITDLTAAPTQQDFNGLLAKLRTSGILAS